LITGSASVLISCSINGLTTCSATVLITRLSSGLAALSSNPDYSLNVDIASRQGRFHPDDIPVIAGISETGAGGFVLAQLGCVAGCHPPTHIILA
jgi:hypothetical protein